MIKLEVEEYCQNCPCFEVEQTTNAMQSFELRLIRPEHHIYCAHRDKCKAIKEHLQTGGEGLDEKKIY